MVLDVVGPRLARKAAPSSAALKLRGLWAQIWWNAVIPLRRSDLGVGSLARQISNALMCFYLSQVSEIYVFILREKKLANMMC